MMPMLLLPTMLTINTDPLKPATTPAPSTWTSGPEATSSMSYLATTARNPFRLFWPSTAVAATPRRWCGSAA